MGSIQGGVVPAIPAASAGGSGLNQASAVQQRPNGQSQAFDYEEQQPNFNPRSESSDNKLYMKFKQEKDSINYESSAGLNQNNSNSLGSHFFREGAKKSRVSARISVHPGAENFG